MILKTEGKLNENTMSNQNYDHIISGSPNVFNENESNEESSLFQQINEIDNVPNNKINHNKINNFQQIPNYFQLERKKVTDVNMDD